MFYNSVHPLVSKTHRTVTSHGSAATSGDMKVSYTEMKRDTESESKSEIV